MGGFSGIPDRVFGALRLAKFNIDDRQTTSFIGLPIPANAIFWIGVVAWNVDFRYIGDAWMTALVVLFPLLMVSSLPMFSLKVKTLSLRSNVRRYACCSAPPCSLPPCSWRACCGRLCSTFCCQSQSAAMNKIASRLFSFCN